jgi:hypothetical protein
MNAVSTMNIDLRSGSNHDGQENNLQVDGFDSNDSSSILPEFIHKITLNYRIK